MAHINKKEALLEYVKESARNFENCMSDEARALLKEMGETWKR